MIAVEGDVSIVGLGFSPETLETLKDVSVIFHSAASVRFDDLLKSAIILNTRGTHEVIKFALRLENLVSFIHVSTTYCYPDQRVTDEKVRTKVEEDKLQTRAGERTSDQAKNPLNLNFSDLSSSWRVAACN